MTDQNEDVTQSLQAQLDELAGQLDFQRRAAAEAKERELLARAALDKILATLPEQSVYDGILVYRKQWDKNVDTTKQFLADVYTSLYTLTQDKKAHPSGDIRLIKSHLIDDMTAAVEWCIDHKLTQWLEITDVKGFVESVQAYKESSDFCHVAETPKAYIKSDLGIFRDQYEADMDARLSQEL